MSSITASPRTNPQKSQAYYFENVVFQVHFSAAYKAHAGHPEIQPTESGMSDFQVENSLFSVPKWYFTEHSSIFHDMFSVPAPSGKPVEGSSEDHPLILEGVRAEDFEALISLMYPLPKYGAEGFCDYPRNPLARTTDEKMKFLTSTLQLARKWYFHGLHAYSIKHLSECLDPADKIILGKRYDIPSWINEGCKEIVDRVTLITDQEAKRLGWRTTLGLIGLREARFMEVTRWPRRPVDVTQIREVFTEEISQADSAHTAFYADANLDP